MKYFNVDYSTPTPMATIIFNGHTRRNQKDDVATLPGLKPSAKTPRYPSCRDATLRAMCKTFDVDTEMQVVIYNLLTGGDGTDGWRIVEVKLDCGLLTLCLAKELDTKIRASVHGSQFQKELVELNFEGLQDELALSLLPERARGAVMNDFGNDVFDLRSPSQPNLRVWNLQSRTEIVW